MAKRSSSSPSRTVLSDRALNRALLARQWLLARVARSVPDALEQLVGMQAQAPNPPYIGLWTRLEAFAPEALSSLIRDRAAVRIALMRGTVHVVTARDCLALRPVVQPVLDRSLVTRTVQARQLAGIDLLALASAARALVDVEPRTNAVLGAVLAAHFPDRDPAALVQGARALLPLVQVPPRGLWGESGQTTSTTAEAWLGEPLSRDATPDAMVLRYLAAFGPASVADAQTWSSLPRLSPTGVLAPEGPNGSAPGARTEGPGAGEPILGHGLSDAFERLRPQLIVFEDERGRELFDLPDAPRPEASAPAPVRFLPEYDNALLSHADRTRIISDADRKRIATPNGIVPGTLLVDGFVRGAWKHARGKGASTLRIELFAALSRRERAEVRAEGGRLLALLAPDVVATRAVEILQHGPE